MKKLKKIYICLIITLVSVVSLISVGTKVKANSFEYAKSYIDMEINDVANYTWFALFSINYKQITDTSTYRFIKQSYDEGQQHLDVITFLRRNTSDIDLIIDNTNIYMYGLEWYFFTYSNSNKRIIIWHIYITDYENGIFAINESTLIYQNPQVYNVLADWYSGQLSDYSNKLLTIYGQTIQKGYDINANYNNTNKNYINDLLSYYCKTPILGEVGHSAYLQGKSDGYDIGYDVGYADGESGDTAISPVLNVLQHVFSVVGTIFSIELVPHVPLGLFILIPIFFAVLGLILWIWRRN